MFRLQMIALRASHPITMHSCIMVCCKLVVDTLRILPTLP